MYREERLVELEVFVEEVRVVKNRKTGNWVESVVDIRWIYGMTLADAELIERKYQCKSNK